MDVFIVLPLQLAVVKQGATFVALQMRGIGSGRPQVVGETDFTGPMARLILVESLHVLLFLLLIVEEEFTRHAGLQLKELLGASVRFQRSKIGKIGKIRTIHLRPGVLGFSVNIQLVLIAEIFLAFEANETLKESGRTGAVISRQFERFFIAQLELQLMNAFVVFQLQSRCRKGLGAFVASQIRLIRMRRL